MRFDADFEDIILARSISTTCSRNRIMLDGMSIAAHRLFGPVSLYCSYMRFSSRLATWLTCAIHAVATPDVHVCRNVGV